MDTQQAIVDAISKMSDRQNNNHIEVVQRLTALETKFAPYESLTPRVASLEGWRGKITGAFALLSAIGSAILAIIAKVKLSK